jgi:hypothetical protein
MVYPCPVKFYESSKQGEIPEVIERQAQELSDMLTELIQKAEELKRRVGGNSNRDSNSLGGILTSFAPVPIPLAPIPIPPLSPG